MLNSVSNSNPIQTVLAQNDPRLLSTGASGFPMQNLIAMADDPLAAVSSRDRISLTPQSFASIIAKSIVQAVQGVVSIFVDKLAEIFGMRKSGSVQGAGSSGATSESTGTGSTSGTQGTSGTSGTSGADDTEASSGTQESGGIVDSVKDFFGKIGDFFFGGKGGIGEVLKDIVTAFIPGGALKIGAVLKKFKGAGKALKNILRLGKSAIGSLFKTGSSVVSKLFKSGKNFFKKLF